ncbi:MAG: FGGY-family carbohydrate kinase [Sulfitobacter sp.]
MNAPRNIAVIDIGKTNAKLALVDLQTLTEIAVVTRPNTVHSGPPWPHFDVEGHWTFLLDALGQFHRTHGIDGISITTHGACAALLRKDGSLAAAILDYEHSFPADVIAAYDAIRPPFELTGSPLLPGGLNLGAQLYWQFSEDTTLHERTASIVPYPQYWGHRLTGKIASDVASIGCHTDLWLPTKRRFSSLVESLGLTDKIAPVVQSTKRLGHITPDVAAQTGLSPSTPVAVGIHDSNASFYPHLLTQSGPFSVVSTGTWVIAMSSGSEAVQLDQTRDTLMNVNAIGAPLPSARFMGGREYEVIQQGQAAIATADDIAAVLRAGVMLLPAVEPSTGPFQGKRMRWVGAEPAVGTGQRSVALAFYLAMMTETCLELTGAQGPTIVEGPFAQNHPYLSMLATATDRPILQSRSETGTSIGAALLFGNSPALEPATPLEITHSDVELHSYAIKWRNHITQ